MAAYVVVQVLEVTDPERLSRYARAVGQMFQPFGGHAVAGGKAQFLDGELQPLNMFVIEFPSQKQVQQWYDSELYREPKALRLRSARMNLFVVPGM